MALPRRHRRRQRVLKEADAGRVDAGIANETGEAAHEHCRAEIRLDVEDDQEIAVALVLVEILPGEDAAVGGGAPPDRKGGAAGVNGRLTHHLGAHIDEQHLGKGQARAIGDAAHLLDQVRRKYLERRQEAIAGQGAPRVRAAAGRRYPSRAIALRDGALRGARRDSGELRPPHWRPCWSPRSYGAPRTLIKGSDCIERFFREQEPFRSPGKTPATAASNNSRPARHSPPEPAEVSASASPAYRPCRCKCTWD